jgi:polysaccharide export outer membrane protein
MLLMTATGCTATSVGVSRGTPLSQFLAASRAATAQVYRLNPGDQITTRFYFNPQLDEDLQVRPDGNISLSLVGEMRAVGKTAGELSADITKSYAQYFVKPTAVVIVRQFTSYRVFTAGELRNPGQLSLITGARTVLECISASGGVTDNATLRSIILVRTLPNGKQPMVTELDVSDALSGADPAQNVALMPNDFVYVPRSGAADFNLALQQYFYRVFNLSTSANFGVSYGIPSGGGGGSNTIVAPSNSSSTPVR